MREKVTGTEYFMALSLAGSEGPQPRAGPGCVCQGALALTVQEMRQEQSLQAGGELLTEIDEPSYLGTAHHGECAHSHNTGPVQLVQERYKSMTNICNLKIGQSFAII